MANYRNEFEFRSGLLDALGVEHTEADAKNEERWRGKMLDGLGVEYNQNDVNQFDLFRAKLVEGVGNYSGGGSSWQTVFEGSVTTEAIGGAPFANGDITGVESLTADTIKVTFNGVEYTCEKRSENDSYGAPYDDGYDWSEYPFCITTGLAGLILVTETAGTYTLKIEEPQSGGSSDFSTAEVTINKGEIGAAVDCIIPWFSEEDNETNAFLTLDELTESWTVKVPVGGNFITVYFSRAPQSISGDIEAASDMDIMSQTLKAYVITGDCTVNFS